MNKYLLFFLASIAAFGAQAQPKMIGMTNLGGANGGGTIIQYVGDSTDIENYFVFPSAGCPGCGSYPTGSLIEVNGGLYGLTQNDGANYVGSLFEYNYATNTDTVLVNFDLSTTGGYPQGSLLRASNGKLYGLTSQGGANNAGTLFSYTIGDNTATKLADMPTASTIVRYNSLIQSSNGKLYGMTSYDGTNFSGTIFEFDINSNTYTVKYNLPNNATPYGDLLELGHDTLYGLTYGDGSHHSGTIFSFAIASSTYTPVYSFDSVHGANPLSSLIKAPNGKLYGSAYAGGAHGDGVLFSFDPITNTYTDVHDFDGTDGQNPEGSPYPASDGALYGMTSGGGSSSNGTIYQYYPGTGAFTAPVSFDYTDGSAPKGGLLEYTSTPALISQPTSQSACQGSLISFSSYSPAVTSIQWQIDTGAGGTFVNIPGATDSIYSFYADVSQNGLSYRVIITNAGGSDTSASATLSVPAVPDSATAIGTACSVTGTGTSYQWITCGTHQAISGATSQSYTATQNGSYQCIVTIGECSDTTNCVSVTNVGIDEINGNEYRVYPDPTSGIFFVRSSQGLAYRVEIESLLGVPVKSIIKSGRDQSIDISDLSSSIYIVRIIDDNNISKTFKITKQ